MAGFLEALRHRLGLRLGPSEHIRLAKLLFRLRERGIELKDPETAAQFFAPVLTRHPHDQQAFLELLPELWQQMSISPEPEPELVPEHTSTLDEERKLSWRWGIALGLLTLVIVLYAWIFGDAVQPEGLIEPEKIIVEPSVEVEDLLRPIQTIPGNLILAIMPVLAGFAYVIWSRRRRRALTREFSLRDVQSDRLKFDLGLPRFFAKSSLFPSFQTLARHQEVPSKRIDVRASVRATIHAGGLLALRHRTKPQLPDYLVLVDRASPDDHLSALAADLIEQLRRCHINVSRYDFHRVPNRFFPDKTEGAFTRVEFGTLLALAEHRRLLIVSDGDGFFPPMLDRPYRWLTSFQRFSLAALITPKALEKWGAREDALVTLGFDVFPATPHGVQTLAHRVQDQPHQPEAAGSSPDLQDADPVPFMRQRFGRWLEKEAPPKDDIDRLIVRLETWLGPQAFELLAATAIYPEVKPELTRLIAGIIADEPVTSSMPDSGRAASSEARFGSIARILWLRHGRMPDWMRRALLDRLAPARAKVIRAALQAALLNPVGQGNLSLDVASESRWTLTEVMLTLMRSRDSDALKDRVFLDFLHGDSEDPKKFEIGRALIRRLRPKLAFSDYIILGSAALLSLGLPWLSKEFFGDSLAEGLATIAPSANWLYPLLLASSIGGLLLLLASQFRLSLAPFAQGSLALALILSLASAIDNPASAFYVVTSISQAAALVLAFLLETTSSSREQPSPQKLLTGDRWLVSTACLAVPVFTLCLAQPFVIDTLAGSATTVADRWLNPSFYILYLAASFAAALWIALLTKPRMQTPIRDVLKMAGAFVLAEVVVDGAFVLVVQGDQSWPELRLGQFAVPADLWSNLRLTAGLVSVAVVAWRSSIVSERSAMQIALLVLGAALFMQAFPINGGSLLFWILSSWLHFVVIGIVSTLTLCLMLGRIEDLQLNQRSLTICLAILSGPFIAANAATSVLGVDQAPALDVIAPYLAAAGILTAWPMTVVLRADLHSPHIPHPSSDYPWEAEGKAWIWSLVPLIWIFICCRYGFGPANFGFDYLSVPLAAWLGYRHGRRGLRVLTVGTVPLLVGIEFAGLSVGMANLGPPALFFALQLICRLFGQREYRLDCLRADWISNRQKAYLFVILAVYADFVVSVVGIDFTISTQLSDYVAIIFLIIGMSSIKFRNIALPLFLIVSLSFLVNSFQSPSMFPRLGGFSVDFLFGGHDYYTSNLVLLIDLFAMFFVGRILREFIAKPNVANRTMLVRVLVLMTILGMIIGVAFDYSRYFDGGMIFELNLGLGSAVSVVALMFAAGLLGGGRGASLACACWALVYIALPLLLIFVFPGDGRAGQSILGISQLSNAEIEIRWYSGSNLVSLDYGLFPGWSIGPLDLLFAVFGWRVHRALLKRSQSQISQEAAVASGHETQFRLPVDLPPLRRLYMDKFWIWPTGLILVIGTMLVLFHLFMMAPLVLSSLTETWAWTLEDW